MFHDYSNGTGLKQHEPDFNTWKNDHKFFTLQLYSWTEKSKNRFNAIESEIKFLYS